VAETVTGSLVINKATATLAWQPRPAHLHGLGRCRHRRTTPGKPHTGLTVTGSGTSAGSYPASASLVTDNYVAETVTGSLVINKRSATLALGKPRPAHLHGFGRCRHRRDHSGKPHRP